jgi:peptidyl-prolyl cis-trans isomerase-like protein 2
MVKRQKEKQYLSATEQKAQGRSRSNTGGGGANNAVGIVQKSLPFKCCALTLTSFENPVCTIVEQEDGQGQEQGNNSNNNNNKYGVVFDNAALMEYVIKNKKDPVTGKKLTIASKPGIIKLNIDKDTDTGEWQCPVMTKVFSDYSTKIIAILTPSKKEANVYSYEAYNELNLKPKNYIDLTTGYKFSPKNDVLILNDPTNQNFQRCVRDVSTFWHIKNARSKNKLNSGSSGSGSGGGIDNGNVRKSVTATRVMEQLYKDKKQRDENKKIKLKEDAKALEKKKLYDDENNDPLNHYTFDTVPNNENITFPISVVDVTGVKFTTGSASGGFTSTADNTVIAGGSKDGRHAYASKEAILQSQFNLMISKSMKGRKGYVRLFIEIKNDNSNNDGPSMLKSSKQNNNNVTVVPLLLELHCDIVPRTCTNFLGLCRRKRYDGTIFHRLISNFMIQGGGEKMKQTKKANENTKSASASALSDPTTTTRKYAYNSDASLWGPEPFEDEFDQRLKHDGEGILAMANSGENTNKQQFYITFNSCTHLDRKHTVFGKIAEGMKEFNTALSKVKTDSKDRPYVKTTTTTNTNSDGDGERTTIINNAVVVIVATEILDDPAMDAQKKEEQRLIELHESREAALKNRKRKLVSVDNNNSASATMTTTTTTKIGKYLSGKAVQNNSNNNTIMEEDEGNAATTVTAATAVGTSNSTIPGLKSLGLPAIGATTTTGSAATAKTKAKTKFGNFSSW